MDVGGGNAGACVAAEVAGKENREALLIGVSIGVFKYDMSVSWILGWRVLCLAPGVTTCRCTCSMGTLMPLERAWKSCRLHS